MITKPKKDIDWNRVDELLVCGCTGVEIAAHLGIHNETLYRRVEAEFSTGFSDYAQQKRAVGDSLLKEQQYKKAMGQTAKGDNTLLIFLGKQRLGQRDNPQEKVVPEDLTKTFELLMLQIMKAQEKGQSVESKTPEIPEVKEPARESAFV